MARSGREGDGLAEPPQGQLAIHRSTQVFSLPIVVETEEPGASPAALP